MIRVIIERQVKNKERLLPMLRELRAAAVHQPGYVTGETMVSTEDDSITAVISTWHSLEQWQAWETSETRATLYELIEPLLVKEPRIRVYRVIATEEQTV
jgi:quinol monooxygenase YgiN